MKKWVYFAFLALFSAPAMAQEIVLGKRSYPLVIAIPLLIVGTLWFFVLVSYLYRKKDWFFGHVLKLHTFFKRAKAKKKEVNAVQKVEEKKKDLSPYSEKIENFELRLPRLKTDAALKEFAQIARDFFSDLLNLNYEFTDEELIAHVGETKKEIAAFAKEVSEIKYSQEGVSPEKVQQLVHDFKRIARPYLHHLKSEKKTFNIFEKIIEEDKKVFDNIRGYVDHLKKESKKKEIVELLSQERRILKDDISSLKKTYNKILEMYVQLSPQERAQLYPQLVEFYNAVNSSIFSTVYGEKSKEQLNYFLEKLRKMRDMPRKESFLLQVKKTFFPARPKVVVHQLPSKQKKPSIFSRLFAAKKHSKSKPAHPRALEMPVPPQPIALKVLPKERHASEPFSEEQQILQVAHLDKASKQEKKKLDHLKKILEARKTLGVKLPAQKTVPQEKKTITPVALVVQAQPIASDGLTEKQRALLNEERQLLGKLEGMQQGKQHEVNYLKTVKKGITESKMFLKQERLRRAEHTYDSIMPYFAQLSGREKKSVAKDIKDLSKEIAKLKEQNKLAPEDWKKQAELTALEKEEKHLLSELDKVMKSF